MDPQQQFCLKWNSFGNNLVTTFETLFKSESLTDVTLFCEGVTFKAHKIILAACSKHFQDLFEAAPFSPHILLILDGTSSSNMSALLEFMYKGEVHVSQESLSGFLKAAESLQIKGLSMEQEQRLVSGGARVSDLRVGGKTPTGMPSSLKLVGEGDTSEGMHPPSSTGYSSILSPYLSHYRGGSVPGAPSTSPYDHPPPRKRHHRSPSDSNQRASVLRVGVPERESPLPLTYSPHLSPHEFNFHRSTGEREAEHHDSSNSSSTLPFAPQTQAQEPVAVESTPPATASAARTSPEWRASSQEPPSNSCPEDLRIKTEPRSSNSSSGTGNHNSTTSSEHNHRPSDSSSVNSSRADTNHHEINHMGDESWREQTNGKQGGQTGGGGEHVGAGGERGGTVWNSTTGTGYQTSAEISNAHKSAIATTTPTGKKLQCPYCERLYGYETNLRAHIRQRHQGIRAPCPYCSRTFTRNNTVRRHIAREHKTELNLTAKAFQLSQVQNHNQ